MTLYTRSQSWRSIVYCLMKTECTTTVDKHLLIMEMMKFSGPGQDYKG